MTSHLIEYAKSGRAKCHGKCNGDPIEVGSLRYGTEVTRQYGPVVEWWHWRCVTPYQLGLMRRAGPHGVQGFGRLKSEDKARIESAIKNGYVDPSEAVGASQSTAPSSSPMATSSSSSALTMPPPTAIPSSTQGTKRKATSSVPLNAQASRSDSQSIQTIDLTEDDVIDVDSLDIDENEFYCRTLVEVVGLQYYSGLVGAGEEVLLLRQPENIHDRNAIQVQNIAHVQVGHLARKYAERLSPLIDQKLINIEGTMLEERMNLRRKIYTLKMNLNIYGPASKREELEPKFHWATGPSGFPPRKATQPPPSQGVAGPSSSQMASTPSTSSYSLSSAAIAGISSTQVQRRAPSQQAQLQEQQRQRQLKIQEDRRKAIELAQQLSQLQKINDESRRSSLLDSLCSVNDVLNLPVHPNPPGIANGQLKVELLKHQKQALQWFLDRECPKLPEKEDERPVQFWQYKMVNDRPFYWNLATKTPQEAAPVLGRGALCADSMGLGKTLSILSLILATKNDEPLSQFCKSTLVVVPLSVLSNWETQIKDHCVSGTLSYLIYYDAGRYATADQVKKFDVVITTYQIVAGEHDGTPTFGADGPAPSQKKRRTDSTLFEVPWKRIVLDEGHIIRNSRTKTARACCALNAERRWVITGTPIINAPSDLGSILKFLQICRPLDNEDFFKRLLLRPLKNGEPEAAELLKALMSQISLRRTKEMQDSEGRHLVPLPPVEMTVVPVQLSEGERELYDAAEALSKEKFENYMLSHGGHSVPTNVLAMLTRLRQLALHPGLVPANYLDELRNGGDDHGDERPIVEISPQERLRLQGILAQMIEDNEECSICFDTFTDPRITSCSHVYCLACISAAMERDSRCPMDRRQITMGDLVEPPPPVEATQVPLLDSEDEPQDDLRTGSSSKIDQLVYLLQLTPSTEKCLVFSQFTKYLDKIAERLESEGIPYLRFDGKMSSRSRQEVLERFSIPIHETDQPAPPTQLTQSRSARQRRSAASSVTVADDDEEEFQPLRRRRSVPSASSSRTMTDDDEIDLNLPNGDDDSDYRDDFGDAKGNDADHDSFIDDDGDDELWVKSKSKSRNKGKGKAAAMPKKPKKTTSLPSKENPRVLLISLKCGALGLNLTVANNVFLMDPWWQEGIESQAIDRCNRIGQKKPVHVYQLIAENTVESKVLDIQEKKKTLIKQAFSGFKSNETQRQKKEARLQELVELFGVRQRGSVQTTLDVGTGSA